MGVNSLKSNFQKNETNNPTNSPIDIK